MLSEGCDNMSKVVCIVSGGMDSITLLYKAKSEFKDVAALSFDYGQKHVKELECAIQNCKELGVAHKIINLKSITSLLDSSLTTEDKKIPEGHYAEESMKQTVVPNRNTIMLSIAYAYALSLKADEVWFGAHAGDHAIYPDCRQVYIDRLQEAFQEGNWPMIQNEDVDIYPKIVAPFIDITKKGIITQGVFLQVPYWNTYSCYKGRQFHCGVCGTCRERIEAFQESKIVDPIKYDINVDWTGCKVI